MNAKAICAEDFCNKTSVIREISKLRPPESIKKLDYEVILSEVKTQLQATLPSKVLVDSLYEADPIIKIAEVIAYRELYMRQRVNDALKDIYLQTAKGNALSQLAYLLGISREVTDPQNKDNVIERTDAELIDDIVNLYEGVNTGGALESYRAIGMSVDYVKDIYVEVDPAIDAKVNLYVWIDARPNTANYLRAMSTVKSKVDELRPVSDWVDVQPIKTKEFEIKATVSVDHGIAIQDVKRRVRQNIRNYLSANHKLGNQIKRSEIIASIHKNGVINVSLEEPHDIQVACNELAIMVPPKRTLSSKESYLRDGTLEYSDKEIDSLITFVGDYTEQSIARLPPKRLMFEYGEPNNSVAHCSISIGNESLLIGSLQLIPPKDESYIRRYNIYFGKSSTEKYSNKPIAVIYPDSALNQNQSQSNNQHQHCRQRIIDPDIPIAPIQERTLEAIFTPNLKVPDGVTHLLAYSQDDLGEMAAGISLKIEQNRIPEEVASKLNVANLSVQQSSGRGNQGLLTGLLTFEAAKDASVTQYRLYWANEAGDLISDNRTQGLLLPSNPQTEALIHPIQTFRQDSQFEYLFKHYLIPEGATQLVLKSGNQFGEMRVGICYHFGE